MAVMYSFCFWFSVRLGTIIVGSVSLLQTLVILVLCAVGMEDKQGVKDTFRHWTETAKLLLLTDVARSIGGDPEPFLVMMIVLNTLYCCSCLTLMYGAYKCSLALMYPYMGLELCRLLVLSFAFVVAMMLLKENVYDLGLLIVSSVCGGFLLLYLFYLWFCTLSLCQIVLELQTRRSPLYPQRPITGAISQKTGPTSVGIAMYNSAYNNVPRNLY